MVSSKLTQVCKVIKLIYFVILEQTKTKRRLIYSTYLSRTINNSVLVIRVKAKSVTLRLIISAVF